MRTNGISPKAIAATLTAVLTYVLAQEALELPVYVEVAGQAVLVALAAYFAPPGNVEPDTRGVPPYSGTRGLSLLEVVVVLLAVAVIVLLVVTFD